MKGEAEAGAGQGPCVQTGAPRGGSLALDPELRGREQLLCGEFSSFLPSLQLAPSGGTVRIKVPRLGHSHTPCRVCDRAAAARVAHPGAPGRGMLGAGVAGRGTPGVWPTQGRPAVGCWARGRPVVGRRPWDARAAQASRRRRRTPLAHAPRSGVFASLGPASRSARRSADSPSSRIVGLVC